jgi:hypothetical protein
MVLQVWYMHAVTDHTTSEEAKEDKDVTVHIRSPCLPGTSQNKYYFVESDSIFAF